MTAVSTGKFRSKTLQFANWIQDFGRGEGRCVYLDHRDDRVALEAWKYLNDRVHGKPAQSMKLAGEDGGPMQFVITRAGAKEKDNGL